MAAAWPSRWLRLAGAAHGLDSRQLISELVADVIDLIRPEAQLLADLVELGHLGGGDGVVGRADGEGRAQQRLALLTRAVLGEYLPSVSWVKVVRESENSYIAYEGNGRLAAMQRVFEPADEMLVEVEEYRFRNPAKILRRMNRVRKMNGLPQAKSKSETANPN